MTNSKFITTQNKGFQMTFKNGWTISIQWGTFNYCSRKTFDVVIPMSEMKEDLVTSPDCEIAIWDKNNVWYDFGTDQVKGYCNTDEVAKWIWKVKNFE